MTDETRAKARDVIALFLQETPMVAWYHPDTAEDESAADADTVLAALDAAGLTVVEAPPELSPEDREQLARDLCVLYFMLALGFTRPAALKQCDEVWPDIWVHMATTLIRDCGWHITRRAGQ